MVARIVESPKKQRRKIVWVDLEDIEWNSIQGRVKTYDDFVNLFGTNYKEWADKAIPVLFCDAQKKLWIAEGIHRLLGAYNKGIKRVRCEVRPGTKDDAMLFNIASNKQHKGLGIPVTSDDDRHAVVLMLKCKKTANWADARIASHIGCSNSLVGTVRRGMASDGYKFSAVRITANGHKVDIRNSQKARQERARRDYHARLLGTGNGKSKTRMCAWCNGTGRVPND